MKRLFLRLMLVLFLLPALGAQLIQRLSPVGRFRVVAGASAAIPLCLTAYVTPESNRARSAQVRV